MNTRPDDPNAVMEEQASLWAARLDGGSMDEAGRAELATWLAADPAHRRCLSLYCQLSSDLERDLAALVEAGRVPAAAVVPARRMRPRRRWPVMGAVAGLAAALALVFWFVPLRTELNSVVTPVGRLGQATLPDGTQVELNARSSLALAFTPTERRVRMPDGEVFFAVTKNPERPFIIETPAGSVRVTGTSFAVRTLKPDDLVVTVREGSVQVTPADAHSQVYALTKGDQLRVQGGHAQVRALTEAAVEDELAWRQKQVVFDGTPLREALAQFARHHGRSITASDKAAARKLSGRFKLGDLDAFLASVQQVLPVRVTRDLDGNIRVTEREES